jgi:tRNA A37 threonylcarbamoyladenosine dehydratase
MGNETTEIVEGALVIDVFDAATSEFVWRGTASARIDPEKVDVARIRRAVSEVLARFPRREGKPQRI